MRTLPAYRTWIEVSRSALLWNFGQFQRYFNHKALIAPVVKANAYGHDMAWAAKTLAGMPFWGFCVAHDTEAEQLLKLNIRKPILVMSAWEQGSLPLLIRRKVRFVVWDEQSAGVLSSVARSVGISAIVHAKLDAGTSRIGTRPELFRGFLASVRSDRWLQLEGLFSHYANSENGNLAFSRRQQAMFEEFSGSTPVQLRHIACTAASLRLPLLSTNIVRLGIGLYGLWPSAETQSAARRLITLRPVLSWKTRLLQVKRVPAGTTIGYGRTYRVTRATQIGILPVGYADGYDRRGSNASHVAVSDRRFPVIGRVSMNLITIDLGAKSRIRSGSVVDLIGERVTADDCADAWNTINYEVVSRIDPRLPRLEVP